METPAALQRRLAHFRDWLWAAPAGSEPAWQRHARVWLRVFSIFGREFKRDRISLRASALTFTVLLSLVPTLALGTAVLKGLGGGDQAWQAAYRLIDQIEASADSSSFFDSGGDADAVTLEQASRHAARKAEEWRTLSAHLRRAVDQLFDYVDRTNFAALGTFGMVTLLVAAFSVFSTIEQAMNAIWHVAANRPWGRKLMDYLALMIVLPVSINITLAASTALQSKTLRHHLETWLPLSGLTIFLFNLLPLLLLAFTFALLYRFLPNARVKSSAALAGGAFGGLLWLVTQTIYLKLQLGVAGYNAIYGSFATVPLFLLWLQLCWIIFLSGAEMAFAVQTWRTWRPERLHPAPIARLALAFAIIDQAHHDLASRQVTTLDALASRLGEPEMAVRLVVDALARAGILRRVAGASRHYVLGVDAEKFDPVEVVELILGTEVPPMRGSSLAIEALQAARLAVQHKKVVG
ncbi:MAG TPA: YihY/virulence factor BrkB family protein [Desulfurivibrionaceae bacterium]|nr:YihY/virulence factor BrkB family protein [Desulfurivibrionaceae bacterium]